MNLIARTLASHLAAIKEVSGLEVRLDLAREWTRSVADACPRRPAGSLWLAISLRSVAHTTLFGPWSVKVVNELDRCSKDAQDMPSPTSTG